jgi:hypothetical protein
MTSLGERSPTPTNTPSPSTVPDVLLFFGLDIVPKNTAISAGNIASLPSFLASSAATFAQLLLVPPANVYAVNVSDRTTGAWTSAGLRPVRIRRLQASPSKAPGGVTVTFVVRLGKVPTQASVMNMSAVLSSPLAARSMGVCASAVATQLGLPASQLSASINSVSTQYAPFSISGDTTKTISTRHRFIILNNFEDFFLRYLVVNNIYFITAYFFNGILSINKNTMHINSFHRFSAIVFINIMQFVVFVNP